MKTPLRFVVSALFAVISMSGAYAGDVCPVVSRGVAAPDSVVDGGLYRQSPEEKYALQMVGDKFRHLKEVFDEPEADEAEGEYERMPRRMAGHWAGVGLGYGGAVRNLGNGYQGGALPQQSVWSPSVSVNLVDFAFVRSRRVLLLTGLGFEFDNFRFKDGETLVRDGDGRTVPHDPADDGQSLRSSKLVAAYVNVPLLVEVRFGCDDRFFVNFGAVAGVKIGSHMKYKVDCQESYKSRGHYNLRDFHYGATANVGYGRFGLSATYYFSPMFRPDRGPAVRQANLGLMFYF